MQVFENHYINGEWVPSQGSGTLEVVNPATEEVIATVPAGNAADVDAAVAAARAAFEGWSTTDVDTRAKYLRDIGAALMGKFETVADTITSENGSPKQFAALVQTGMALGEWESFASLIENFEW